MIRWPGHHCRRSGPAKSVVAVIGLAFTAAAHAQSTIKIDAASPTLDRWSYPFANDPGGNHYASVFAALASTGFDPQFDNRDGQMNIGFNTAALGVAPDLGAGS